MLKLLVILLTLATAVVHLRFFIPNPGREWIYGLNALGYVILVALLYFPGARLDGVRPIVRRLLMLCRGNDCRLRHIWSGVSRMDGPA